MTVLVLILPGCVIINAVLGVAGLMTSGPLQYAGAVYSVGEYTYEYAVNDKTPDEVIADKVAWLLNDEGETVQVAQAPNAKPELKRQPASAPALTAENGLSLASAALPVPLGLTRSRARLAPEPAPIARPVAAETPRPLGRREAAAVITMKKMQVRPSPSPAVVEKAATGPTKLHTYVFRESDPLLERMTRMEQGLAQAERMLDRDPAQGVRCSLPAMDFGEADGINGAWSIRHDVMQPSPVPSRGSTINVTASVTPPVS